MEDLKLLELIIIHGAEANGIVKIISKEGIEEKNNLNVISLKNK